MRKAAVSSDPHQMTGEQLFLVGARVSELAREQDFKAIVGMLDQGVIILRPDGYLKYINPAAMRIFGVQNDHDAVEVFNQMATSPSYYADGTRVPSELHPAALVFRTGAFTKQVYGVDGLDGERRWLLTSGRLVNPDDPGSDILVSFCDITAERDELDRLIHQVNHDPLTGLPNRTVVLRRIAEALASNDRRRLRAVMFVDLDDLKSTNDSFGHEAGDDLLIAAASRLRQSMDPADVVARHGGDEFVCLVYGDAERYELDGRVSRLRCRLAEPVQIAAVPVPIRASIGVVEVDHHERRSAEEILNDADRAMYAAKRAGRGR